MDPSQLVEEFKKSGEFDRLRRQLLSQFQRSDGINTFKTKIEDVARQRLASDDKLHQLPPDTVHKELMQEMDRYPIVERAAADVRTFSDPVFIENIHSSIQRILHASKPDNDNNSNNNSNNNSVSTSGDQEQPATSNKEASDDVNNGTQRRSPTPPRASHA